MRLRLVAEKTNFKFVSKRFFCLMFSIVLIGGTTLSLLTQGLNFGIDFSGGVIVEIQTEKEANLAQMRAALGTGVNLQSLEKDNQVLIRVPAHEGVEQAAVIRDLKEKLAQVVDGEIEYRKVDYVGPQVGSELIRDSIIALILSFVAMVIYMWFRFEWQYGLGALMALLHDAAAVIGFYSVSQIEFDLTSVAAVLTVIGYSINDTVVIYDRVRENIRKYRKMPLGELIDLSVNETLARTFNTVFTVLLALIALIFFGGEVLLSFSLGMFAGILVGTYSTVYVSAIALLYLDPRKTELREAETA